MPAAAAALFHPFLSGALGGEADAFWLGCGNILDIFCVRPSFCSAFPHADLSGCAAESGRLWGGGEGGALGVCVSFTGDCNHYRRHVGAAFSYQGDARTRACESFSWEVNNYFLVLGLSPARFSGTTYLGGLLFTPRMRADHALTYLIGRNTSRVCRRTRGTRASWRGCETSECPKAS